MACDGRAMRCVRSRTRGCWRSVHVAVRRRAPIDSRASAARSVPKAKQQPDRTVLPEPVLIPTFNNTLIRYGPCQYRLVRHTV
jgi:hypothetical protein